ncbi:MAG: hypothetical protein IPP17_21500 [Bacteroidetes bacterium]|nr:hypothetical protein [Bacteroidota bacterium]
MAAIQLPLNASSPTVVPFKARDPQLDQATEPLNDSVPLRVLDFGAGKGRIGQEILRNPDTASLIYYQPLEICSDFQADLRKLSSDLQLLSEIEPEIEREVLDSHEKLKESQYKNFFDRILLVNVLHEISPSKWVTILNVLLDSLSKDGKLLILEDQAFPV